MEEELPEGWKTIDMSELFTKEQTKELKEFLKRKQKAGEDPLMYTGELKELFGKWSDDLLAKGVLPDYLAYAFAMKLKQFGYERTLFALSRKKLKEVT